MPPKRKVVKKKPTQKQKQKQSQYVKVVINQPIKRKSRPVAKQSAPVYVEPRVQMLLQQPTAQDIAAQYHMLSRVQSQAKTDILEPQKETADINLIRSLRDDLLSRIESLPRTELLPSDRRPLDDDIFTPRVPTRPSESIYAGFTVKELKSELRSRGLQSSGIKADLIARLDAADLD